MTRNGDTVFATAETVGRWERRLTVLEETMRMGTIRKGSMVVAELAADPANDGTTMLAVMFDPAGPGTGGMGHCVVAPGKVSRACVRADAEGSLRILVDVNSGADRGTLTVTENGEPMRTERVRGYTAWTYSVVG